MTTPSDRPAMRFRTPLWVRVAAGVSAAISSVLTLVLLHANASVALVAAMAALALLAWLGFIDALTARVELRDDVLIVVSNLRRRMHARRALSNVSWARGVATAVRVDSGEWLKLPGVGSSGQGLANSIRAWLKR